MRGAAVDGADAGGIYADGYVHAVGENEND